MAQEHELSDYSNVYELQGRETNKGDTQASERRLFTFGIITLAVLCVTQAALNISLRLAFVSNKEVDQLPFNSSTIADLCATDQSQHDTTQPCSCCNNLLRALLREYEDLKTQRDQLQRELSQKEDYTYSGHMAQEDFNDQEGSADWYI